jgi:PAS domain S-box-containing protein
MQGVAGMSTQSDHGAIENSGDAKSIPKGSLRIAAEARLALMPKRPPSEEYQHELQVYQIELEMQIEELQQAQNVLEASRDSYLDLYEFAPVGYITLNRHGMISDVNHTGSTLLGAEHKKLLNIRFSRFIAPEDCDQWDHHFLGVLKRDGRQSCELQIRRHDGTNFQAQITSLRSDDSLSSQKLDDPQFQNGIRNTSTLMRLVIIDITERKLAENYEQFRSRTLELLSGGASLPDLLEGIVLGVEQLKPEMICSILLLDSQGKHFCKGIGPSLPDSYNAGLEGLEIGIGVGSCGTAAATGKRVIVDDIMTHPYWGPYKELAARAGLSSCWSEPIRSSTGQVLGTFATYHREVHSPAEFDISIIEKSTRLVSIAIERRQAEAALRASEQEFRTLAENLPDLLIRYDCEGRRTYVNPAMERVFAVTPEQLIGTTLREINPTGMSMPETYQRALEHTLATGERSEFDVQIPLPDGKMRTGLCFIVAERAADGRISGAISVSRDISERTRNEAELERHRHHLEKMVEDRTHALSIAKETAEAATRAKSRFLAAASHDLRQPIAAIGLYNDALALCGLNEDQKKMSHNLTRSVGSLGEMLNELLDIAKLDAGKLVPQPAVIQSVELLGTIASEFDSIAREKHLSLNLYCPRRNLALFTDKNLLLTILRNLIGNAVKYTVRGGILVSIRQRDNRALIQVWDTGIGIAPEQLDLIFEEYFQAGNSERNRAKGAGLGLAIVKRVSEALGNRVSCRSRLGSGSVFEISLPLA